MPILFALSEAQLFELARCMGSATFTAGQLVFAKGDPGMVLQDVLCMPQTTMLTSDTSLKHQLSWIAVVATAPAAPGITWSAESVVQSLGGSGKLVQTACLQHVTGFWVKGTVMM